MEPAACSRNSSFASLGFTGATSVKRYSRCTAARLRNPQECLEITPCSLIKDYAFPFKQTLLLVVRQDYLAGGTSALRVDHAMPRGAFRRSVHYESNRSCRITLS